MKRQKARGHQRCKFKPPKQSSHPPTPMSFPSVTLHLPTPFPSTLLRIGVTQCLLDIFWRQSGGWRYIIGDPSTRAARRTRAILDIVGKFCPPRGEYSLDFACGPSDGLLHGPFTLLSDEEERSGRYCGLLVTKTSFAYWHGRRTANDGNDNDNDNDGNESASGQHGPRTVSRRTTLCTRAHAWCRLKPCVPWFLRLRKQIPNYPTNHTFCDSVY